MIATARLHCLLPAVRGATWLIVAGEEPAPVRPAGGTP